MNQHEAKLIVINDYTCNSPGYAGKIELWIEDAAFYLRLPDRLGEISSTNLPVADIEVVSVHAAEESDRSYIWEGLNAEIQDFYSNNPSQLKLNHVKMLEYQGGEQGFVMVGDEPGYIDLRVGNKTFSFSLYSDGDDLTIHDIAVDVGSEDVVEESAEKPSVSEVLTKLLESTPDGNISYSAVLEVLRANGMPFNACTTAFAADATDPFVVAAQGKAEEGKLEVDEKSVLAKCAFGAYVQAWMWISNSDAGIENA